MAQRTKAAPVGVAVRRPPSIQDVASAAGVSTATVSRVLNSPALVSPATAERVLQTVRELGYRPNVFAQSLTTRRRNVLGIALPDIHGEFYSELLRGADAEARRLGYHLLVSSEARGNGAFVRATGEPTSNGRPPSEPAGTPNAEADDEAGAAPGGGRDLATTFGLVGGLVLMLTEPDDALVSEAQESGLPLVMLDAEIDRPGIDSVLVDNEVGTREAVEHMLERTDPARCFFVGGPRENFDTQIRAGVFERLIGAVPGSGAVTYGEYTVDWGRRWVASMRGTGRLADAAVLAANDEIALGIVQAALEAGLRVPESLRVVGFDDTRLASLVRPRLTTVHVPMGEVGAEAVRMLASRINDPEMPRRAVQLPTKLVVRETS